MRKSEFMDALRNQLADIPVAERDDILADYDEHFAIGTKKKRSEADIAKRLGNPRIIAKHIRAERLVRTAQTSKKPRHIVRAVFAAAGLGFFNLLFILGPFLLMCAAILALFVASASLAIAGVGTVVAGIVTSLGLGNIPFQLSVAGIFGGVTGICAGILAVIGMSYVTKWFFIGVIKYLKMNISIITAEDVK